MRIWSCLGLVFETGTDGRMVDDDDNVEPGCGRGSGASFLLFGFGNEVNMYEVTDWTLQRVL